MPASYHIQRTEAMPFSRSKSEMDKLKRPGEVVVRVSDAVQNLGWTVMPISEYVRIRYLPAPMWR